MAKQFDQAREPEIALMIEESEEGVPNWVLQAAAAATEEDSEEAAEWADALANALGRRANRMKRDRLGTRNIERPDE